MASDKSDSSTAGSFEFEEFEEDCFVVEDSPCEDVAWEIHIAVSKVSATSPTCNLKKGTWSTRPVLHTGYPDLFLSIGRVTLGEQARDDMIDKQKKREQKECILMAACALLNGGGGIIRMEAENQSYDYITDALGHDVERALRELVNCTPIHEFFEFNQQGTELLMFVKSWCSSTERASICSISTGLFQRSGTSVDRVSSSDVNRLLQKKSTEDDATSNISQFYNSNNVKLNELLDFGEGTTVDFKDFGSEKLITRLKEQVPKYISAFANTVGGFLFIGVNDARTVTGCGRGKNKEELKECVEEICGKSIAVHRHDCSNSGLSVEHRIIECLAVEDENDTEPCYVLAIKIPAFCCAVFEKHPDSWQIKDSKMCRLMAEPWLRMMERADPGDQLIGCFKKQLSLHDAPPQCKTVYGLQEEHLKRLQEHIFPIGEDDISTGPGTLVESLFGMYENLKNLLTLERRDAPGVLIFSSSWAVDIGRVRNSHVICDALLICQNSPPCLYTVVQEGSKDLWEYVTLTAFHLKQKLVNDGGYSQRVCVVPKLVDCKTGTLIPVEQNSLDGGVEMVRPDCYNLRRVEIESVLRSLVIVLLSFTSVLSDELGCEFLNLLTEEQFQVLQTFEDIKELFVHGLPGSGKTVLAAEIMKRIKNKYDCKKENILYICENQPLKSSMSKKNLCLCLTRKCFMMRNDKYFSEVKHIIVDEGQNFRREDGDWIQRARSIVKENGVFWVFLDHFQQSHMVCSGLPPLGSQSKAYLYKVVRNSQEVSNLLKKEIDTISKRSFAEHEEIAKHLKDMSWNLQLANSFQGSYEVKKMTKDEAVPYLQRLLHQLLNGGSSPKDIAILCSTLKVRGELFTALDSKRSGPRISFTSAEDMDNDAVVVDSIRRFSGLERNIVILIDPHAHAFKGNVKWNLLVAAISRARIRLIVIESN